MKTKLTLLLLGVSSISVVAQWKHSINQAANPARELPYSYYDYSPFEDNFLAGYPSIYEEALDFGTQQMVHAGDERYPIDSEGNYIEMFRATAANTLVWHKVDLSYTGSNPTSYRIESWHNDNLTSIRNAIATFSGNNFSTVQYTDSNFLPGLPSVTSARDSFVYNGNELIEMYVSVDTGAGMQFQERHRFEYANSLTSSHYTDEWDTATSAFVNDIRVRLVYDGNNHMDSTISYDWVQSNWVAHKVEEFIFDTDGKITEYLYWDEDGSGGLEEKDKWEFTYNAENNISELMKYDFEGDWVNEAKYIPVYCDDNTLNKVELFPYLDPSTLFPSASAVWIYGDTSIDCSTTSVSELVLDMEVNIYPNPISNGNLNIETNGDYAIKIINSIGQLVYQKEYIQNNTKVDIIDFKSGIYTALIEQIRQSFQRNS